MDNIVQLLISMTKIRLPVLKCIKVLDVMPAFFCQAAHFQHIEPSTVGVYIGIKQVFRTAKNFLTGYRTNLIGKHLGQGRTFQENHLSLIRKDVVLIKGMSSQSKIDLE